MPIFTERRKRLDRLNRGHPVTTIRKTSMTDRFHRRLALLGSVGVLLVVTMGGQLVRLTIAEHEAHASTAEARLSRNTYLPTWRGSILDRKGRELAVDRPSYDVAVEYDVISGAWENERAKEDARRAAGFEGWKKMGPGERLAAIDAQLPRWHGKVEELWTDICRLGGIDRKELDRRLTEIRTEVERRATKVWNAQRVREEEKFGIIEGEEFKPRPIREMEEAHVVLPRVADEVAFEFRRLGQELSDVIEVKDTMRRSYPWATAEVELSRASLPKPIRSDKIQKVSVIGVADHIVGSMRDAPYQEDMERNPFVTTESGKTGVRLEGYRPGDAVGTSGVEESFEDYLRGSRGQIQERLDTGEKIRTEPKQGKTLQLTIDIALQARIQGLLSPEFGLARIEPWNVAHDEQGHPKGLPEGYPLNAAAVVLDVDSGEILAMVSTPTVAMGRQMTENQRKVMLPAIHRAVETPYPPGSIIKPIVLAGAVTNGVFGLNDRISCTGHFWPERKDVARCWIYRANYGFSTHNDKVGGPLSATEAIARSCNIFFYTLAHRLGMRRLTDWYSNFGLGEPLNVGLLHEELVRQQDHESIMVWRGENGGSIPSPQAIEKLAADGQSEAATIFMGIGQGPVTWTPVHAANAFAQLARGGTIRDATLIRQGPGSPSPRRSGGIPIKPAVVSTALEGLREAVGETYGTGHHLNYGNGVSEPIFTAEEVEVWGKTGTAQAAPMPVINSAGKQTTISGLDHAWFVGLVGPKSTKRPTIAIAVILEYGGSGGRAAGPIANQIIIALQDEGYLPSPPSPTRGREPEHVLDVEEDDGQT